MDAEIWTRGQQRLAANIKAGAWESNRPGLLSVMVSCGIYEWTYVQYTGPGRTCKGYRCCYCQNCPET